MYLYCQSCGMPLNNNDYLGTNLDRTKSDEYCYYCLKDGLYTVDYSMEQMIDVWIKYSDEYNRYASTDYSKTELEQVLKDRFPHLKRWKQRADTDDSYYKSINKVVVYINEHLFDELSLAVLSERANISEYHFLRVFNAFTGENPGEYIQRLRLESIAHKLVSTSLSIKDIQLKTNYGSVQSLSKAFKKHFSVSPMQFRKQSESIKQSDSIETSLNYVLAPDIVTLESKKILFLDIKKAYKSGLMYNQAWQKFIDYTINNGLNNDDAKYLSISFDDPEITPQNRCRFYIGMIVSENITPKGRFGVMQIPDGEYAVFRYKGSYSNLFRVYYSIYKHWLPESGCELRDTFSFEIYVNTPREVEEADLITEIYIPIVR